MPAGGEIYRRLKAIKDAKDALGARQAIKADTRSTNDPEVTGQGRQVDTDTVRTPPGVVTCSGAGGARTEGPGSIQVPIEPMIQMPLTASPEPVGSDPDRPGEYGEPWEECQAGVWRRVKTLNLETSDLAPGIRALLSLDGMDGLLEDFCRRFHFDTETTGLSGGAGTRIFLLGWSRLLPPRHTGRKTWSLEIRQYFLADFPWEGDFIALVGRDLGHHGPLDPAKPGILVTYNGASFDLPLARTRWIMNGLAWPEPLHHDCLHPARRLWKSLVSSCSLGSLESLVLGVERHGDPGGAMVPQLYFDWLRDSATRDFRTELAGVLGHHRQDLVSLWGLDLAMAWLGRQLKAGGREMIRWTGPRMGVVRLFPAKLPLHTGGQEEENLVPAWELAFDPAGIMRQRFMENERDEARELARTAWDRFQDPWWGKRLGALVPAEEAYGIYREIWEKTDDPLCLRACLIYLEHRAGDVQAALDLLDRAGQASWDGLDPGSGRLALEMAHRRQRLLRKRGPEGTNPDGLRNS